MFTLLFHKVGDIFEGDEGVVRDVQFFVPREHSPELFATTEVTLHNIPPFIQLLVILPKLLPVTLRRHRKESWEYDKLDEIDNAFITFANLCRSIKIRINTPSI